MKSKTIKCPWCDWERTFESYDHPFKEYADPFHSRGKKMLWSHIYQKHRITWQKIIDEKWVANNRDANFEISVLGWTSLLELGSPDKTTYLPPQEDRINGHIMCEV